MPPRKQASAITISDDENDTAPVRKTKRRGKEIHETEDDDDYIPDQEELEHAEKAVKKIPLLKEEVQAVKKKASQRSSTPRSVGSSRGRGSQGAGPSNQQGGGSGVNSNAAIQLTDKMLDDAEGVIIHYRNEEVAAEMKAPNQRPTRQGMDALTRLVIRHVLFSHTEKPGMPISRTDLVKVITSSTTTRIATGIPGYIISIAQRRLVEDFGLEMAELVRKTRRGAAGGDGQKYFVVRSIVPWPLYDAVVGNINSNTTNTNTTTLAKQGLLSVILGVIHLAGGSISERDLWNYLSNTGVKKESTHHPAFDCAPSTLMDEFVKKRQLIVDKENGPDGVEMVYSIGEAVEWEVGEKRIKEFYEDELAEGVGGGDNGDE